MQTKPSANDRFQFLPSQLHLQAQRLISARPFFLEFLWSSSQANCWVSNMNQTNQTNAFAAAFEMTDQPFIKRKKTLEVSAMIGSPTTLQLSPGGNEQSPAFHFSMPRPSAYLLLLNAHLYVIHPRLQLQPLRWLFTSLALITLLQISCSPMPRWARCMSVWLKTKTL